MKSKRKRLSAACFGICLAIACCLIGLPGYTSGAAEGLQTTDLVTVSAGVNATVMTGTETNESYGNGLFGGGGGMVLAPALTGWCHMEQKRALATCVAAILPLCLLSAAISLWRQPLDWMQALPYLLGGLGGGFVGGRLFQKVSNLWLRRIFACFLLYGGVRYLL